MIHHVCQEHPFGCGIACVAMIAGVSYTEARRHMGGDYVRGMTHYEVWEALARYGYAIQFVFQREQRLGNLARTAWPLRPWAPVHIVQVTGHYVVMLEDGSILDPAVPSPAIGRTLADYPALRITNIMGIYSVNSQPSI